jgi:hypothetical protein
VLLCPAWYIGLQDTPWLRAPAYNLLQLAVIHNRLDTLQCKTVEMLGAAARDLMSVVVLVQGAKTDIS